MILIEMGHTQSTVVVIRVGSFESSDLPLTTKLSHAFNDNLGKAFMCDTILFIAICDIQCVNIWNRTL